MSTQTNDYLIFVISQGADWIQQITLENSNGSAVDLTGCAVHMQVRPYPGSDFVQVDLSTAASTITITNPTGGVISWDVPGSQTGLLTPTLNRPIGEWPLGTSLLGYYDLRVKFPNGQIFTYLTGKVYMRLGVTIPF